MAKIPISVMGRRFGNPGKKLWLMAQGLDPSGINGEVAEPKSMGHGKVIPPDTVLFGEVGLAGEIRPVQSGQERIKEAAKHGFKRIIAPSKNLPKTGPKDVELVGVNRLSQALQHV